MTDEQSSIQRFLQNRASQILMVSYQRAGSTTQIVIGVLCLAVGAGLTLAGILSHVSGLILGSIGPWIAGVINVSIGTAMRRRQNQPQTEARLTPEARSFLWGLMKQTNTGWYTHGHRHGHFGVWDWTGGSTPTAGGQTSTHPGQSFLYHLGKQWGFVSKTPKDILPKTVHDLLDTACFHYNRVWGILEASKSDSGFTKIAISARNGADEALFSILHHTATLHRYPETVSAASRDCEEKIRALKELADGLERIQLRPASISDRLGYTSAMDSALEEVRLERLAREELGHQPNEGPGLRERL